MFLLGVLEVTSNKIVTTPGGEFKEGMEVYKRVRCEYAMLSRASGGRKLLQDMQRKLGTPQLTYLQNGETRSTGLWTMYIRRLVNATALKELRQSPALSSSQKEKLLKKNEVILVSEIEGILYQTNPLITFCQIEDTVADSFLLIFISTVVCRLELNADQESSKRPIPVVDLSVRPHSGITDKTIVRKKMKYEELTDGGKVCWKRLHFAFERWFPNWPMHLLIAAFIDPRTRSKLSRVVSDADFKNARSGCFEAFKDVIRAASRAAHQQEQQESRGEASSVDGQDDFSSDEEEDDPLNSIDSSLLASAEIKSSVMVDEETQVAQEARRALDLYINTHYDANDVSNRVPGFLRRQRLKTWRTSCDTHRSRTGSSN